MTDNLSYQGHQIHIYPKPIGRGRHQMWDWSYWTSLTELVRNMDEPAPTRQVAVEEAQADAEYRIRKTLAARPVASL